MERLFLTALLPDDWNMCSACCHPLDKGKHWIPAGPVRSDWLKPFRCIVPFDVAPEQVPRVDVLSGTGTVRVAGLDKLRAERPDLIPERHLENCRVKG